MSVCVFGVSETASAQPPLSLSATQRVARGGVVSSEAEGGSTCCSWLQPPPRPPPAVGRWHFGNKVEANAKSKITFSARSYYSWYGNLSSKSKLLLRESSLRAFTWCASRFLTPTGRLFRHFHSFVGHHDLSQSRWGQRPPAAGVHSCPVSARRALCVRLAIVRTNDYDAAGDPMGRGCSVRPGGHLTGVMLR